MVFFIRTAAEPREYVRSDEGEGAARTLGNDDAHPYGWLQGNVIAGHGHVDGGLYLTTVGRGYVSSLRRLRARLAREGRRLRRGRRVAARRGRGEIGRSRVGCNRQVLGKRGLALHHRRHRGRGPGKVALGGRDGDSQLRGDVRQLELLHVPEHEDAARARRQATQDRLEAP